MSKGFRHFDGKADLYSASRPNYPEKLLAHLASLLTHGPAPAGDVLDVGSGTGIFTRQLRALLPSDITIIGVEPSADMRAKAMASSPDDDSLIYRDGTAERLPGSPGHVRAVVAAASAHLFDRQAFYTEALRLLAPSGLLAIIEYIRDEEGSPAAKALIRFTAEHGGPAGYGRPDYASEMTAHGGFSGIEAVLERWTQQLTVEQYVALALSSSHARPAIDALGPEKAKNVLRGIAEGLLSPEGFVPFGYVFRLVTARRA